MKFKNIVLESSAYHLPDQTISSKMIEEQLSPLYQKLHLNPGRLELMTGIHTRHIWPINTKSSDISIIAANKLFEKSKILKSEVDLLIHASVCRDFLEPATASVVHLGLGLSKNTMIFDLSNACLGVMNAIVVAANMIENGQSKAALIVSGENGGPLLNNTISHLLNDEKMDRKSIKKYIANLTIGSAATAILITHKDFSPSSPQILGGAVMVDSSAHHLCQGSGELENLMMETHSEELLKYGVQLAKSTWANFLSELSLKNSCFDLILTHQVGSAHEKLTLDSLELQHKKTFCTYPFLGNTGSSALPITFMMAEEKGHLKKGDLIAFLGIGSGLSSIMLGIKY